MVSFTRMNLMKTALLGGALAFAAACNHQGLSQLPASNAEVHYQGGGAPPVDVLFVVDDSGSMQDEQDKLILDFQQFIQYFQDLQLDFHLGITTTDTLTVVTTDGSGTHQPGADGALVGVPNFLTPNTQNLVPTFTAHVNVGTQGWRVERGLEGARLAFSEPNLSGANAGFLRPNAILAVIIVSDENDQSTSDNLLIPTQAEADDLNWRATHLEDPTDFINFFLALKGGSESMVNVSAITGVDQQTLEPLDEANDKGCVSPTDSAASGSRYVKVAKALHGAVGSICADSFGPILSQIGATVSGIASAFPLQYAPDPASITVKVDGVVVPQVSAAGATNWTYNPITNEIAFAPGAVPPECAVIEIDYGVADYSTGVTGGNNEVPPAQCGIAAPPVGNTLNGGSFSCDVLTPGSPASFGGLLAAAGLTLAAIAHRRRTH